MLILIGAGFAVASFILLTMRTETGFKYKDAPNQTGKSGKFSLNRKQEQQVEGMETFEEITAVEKPEKGKKEKNKKKDKKGKSSAPLRPQMVPPDLPAEEAVNLNIIDSIDIASMTATAGGGDADIDIPDVPADMTPMANEEGGIDIDNNLVAAAAVESSDTGAGMIDPFSLAADLPQPDMEMEQLAEETDKDLSSGSSSDDIFAIFDEVDDEEESEASLFAKELDDVGLDDMLSETVNISQDLKNIFNQFRRA